MATDHNFKVKNGLTVQGDTLVVNHTGDVDGTQVYIKKKDASTNLMRWGEGTSGVTTYKWRMDQYYEFIGNNGTDVIVLKSSDGSIQGQSYKIGSTTIIDSSRNLSNIASISSGAIASTGTISTTGQIEAGTNIQLGGGYNLSWGGAYSSGKPTIAANSNTLYFYPTGNVSGQRLYLNATSLVNAGSLISTDYIRTTSDGIFGQMSDEWHTDNALRGGNFSADIGNDTTVLKLFPASINDESGNARFAGDYSTGIAFMHLDPNNSTWGTAYTGAQAWVGLKVESTPGQEFSSFVIATNSSSTAGTMPVERFKVDKNGEVSIKAVNNTYNFKAFGQDTDSFFGVYDDSNNSANIILTRSDGATMFQILGHTGATTLAGSFSAESLIIDSATAVDKSGNYMVFYDGSGAPALYAGNTADNRNYYQSNHHRFRSDDANTNFGEISATGWHIGATSTPSRKLQVSGDALITNTLDVVNSSADSLIRIAHGAGNNYDALLQFSGSANDITVEGAELWYDNGVGDLHISTTYNHANAAIRFHTRTAGSKPTSNERFKITGDGDLIVSDGKDLSLFNSSTTSDGSIHLPRAGAITFYGDTSYAHSIVSRNTVGSAVDDIRINSYGAVYVNLDSNDNNTSGASFGIGRHGGGSGTMSSLFFEVDGEDGAAIFNPLSDMVVINEPSVDADLQTTLRVGSEAGGLYLTSSNAIIGKGAYYNGAWIATATSGTAIDFTANDRITFNTFSGATVGGSAALGARAYISDSEIYGYGKLHVAGSSTAEDAIRTTNGRLQLGMHTSGAGIWFDRTNNAKEWFIGLQNADSTMLRFYNSGDKMKLYNSGTLTTSTSIYVGLAEKSRFSTDDNGGFGINYGTTSGTASTSLSIYNNTTPTIELNRNGSATFTGQLNIAAAAYEGSIVFGTQDAWHSGIRQHDDGDAELRIWHKHATRGRIHIATAYDGEPASLTRPTNGITVYGANGDVGIGNFSASSPAIGARLHVKSSTDYQLRLDGDGSTWAGINFVDSGGEDKLWYFGGTDTWAFGGGGSSNDSDKRLHVHGGMTIGSGYASTASGANNLRVEGRIETGTYLAVPANSDYQKIRLYGNDSSYAIGMVSGQTYGGLGDWAMTFMFNNDNDRGFKWMDAAHGVSQGAMALTTNGKLTVAHSIRAGYGESDTTTPGAAYTLDVSGHGQVTGRFYAIDGLLKTNRRVSSGQQVPIGHFTDGDQVFGLDPTWTNEELQAYFNSSTVSWNADSTAPGGYAVYINGNVNVGGVYNSGFPYIPVDEDDLFYMECWIRNAGTGQTHYMGSNEFNESFSSLGGNPGSYGYWTMLNTNPGSSWTKVTGYIRGFDANTTGYFENGTKYWTPMALFNYGAGSGTRACYISGWKVIRVRHKGERTFDDQITINDKLVLNNTVTNTLLLNGNGAGISFSGGNNRIFFGGYRAMEGATDGTNLQIGETYTNTFLQSDNTQLSSGSKFLFNGTSNYGIGAGGHNYNSGYFDTLESGSSTDALELIYYQGNRVNIGASGGNKPLGCSQVIFGNTTSRSISHGVGHSNANAVKITGNWNEFECMGRVLDVTYNNCHFMDGYGSTNHASHYLAIGTGGGGNGGLNYVRIGCDLNVDGNITAYYSDARLKQNVETIPNALEILKGIRGVTFEWNELAETVWAKKQGDKDFGMIAQEVDAVFPMGTIVQGAADINKEMGYADPESPNYDPLHNSERDEPEYKTIKYDKMVTLAIQAIKEQQEKIEKLEELVEKLISEK